MSSPRINKDKEWNPNWFELEDFRLLILAWSLGFTGWWWCGQYSELDWAWNKLSVCVCGCKFSLHKYKDLIKVTFIFYNFWWTFLTWPFTAYWCILWYVQRLQLNRVCSPEWNIFMCLFRYIFWIDLLHSLHLIFSLFSWTFFTCLDKRSLFAAW